MQVKQLTIGYFVEKKMIIAVILYNGKSCVIVVQPSFSLHVFTSIQIFIDEIVIIYIIIDPIYY